MSDDTLSLITNFAAQALGAAQNGKSLLASLHSALQSKKISRAEVERVALKLEIELAKAEVAHLHIKNEISAFKQALDKKRRCVAVSVGEATVFRIDPPDGSESISYYACPNCLADGATVPLKRANHDAWNGSKDYEGYKCIRCDFKCFSEYP